MLDQFRRVKAEIHHLRSRVDRISALADQSARAHLLEAAAVRDPNDLVLHGFSTFSQNDEDGILQEIFRRLGTQRGEFAEFGCGDGLENNTLHLLIAGWRGVWLDGSTANVTAARSRLKGSIADGKLRAIEAGITAENVNTILLDAGVSRAPDLISIDIDGNDYWVWSALTEIIPSVVVIEYNATFRPPHKIVQKYRADSVWDGTGFFGASLSALEDLGRRKGYVLVGTCLAGVNAFFVRQDLIAGKGGFSGPFTAERHYRAPFFSLWPRDESLRHAAGIGDYVNLDEATAGRESS